MPKLMTRSILNKYTQIQNEYGHVNTFSKKCKVLHVIFIKTKHPKSFNSYFCSKKEQISSLTDILPIALDGHYLNTYSK